MARAGDVLNWCRHSRARHHKHRGQAGRTIGLSLPVLLACGSRLCGGGLSLPGCRCLASRRPPLPRLRCLLTGCELLGCCHRRLPYGVGSVLEQTGQTNPSDGVMNRPSVARGSLSAPISISGRLHAWRVRGQYHPSAIHTRALLSPATPSPSVRSSRRFSSVG